MEFCPKDGTLMLPSKGGKTSVCPKCGSRTKVEKSDVVMKETIEHEKIKIKRRPKEIEETEATVNAECPKCGNKKALWWVAQAGSGLAGMEDIPDTEFFRCTRCRHTWRKSGL